MLLVNKWMAMLLCIFCLFLISMCTVQMSAEVLTLRERNFALKTELEVGQDHHTYKFDPDLLRSTRHQSCQYSGLGESLCFRFHVNTSPFQHNIDQWKLNAFTWFTDDMNNCLGCLYHDWIAAWPNHDRMLTRSMVVYGCRISNLQCWCGQCSCFTWLCIVI